MMICLVVRPNESPVLTCVAEAGIENLKAMGYTLYRLGLADPKCPPVVLGTLDASMLLKANLGPMKI